MALSRKAWFESFIEETEHEIQFRYIEIPLPVPFSRTFGKARYNPAQYKSYKERLAIDVKEFLDLGLGRPYWPHKWCHSLFVEVSYPTEKAFNNAPDASNILKSVEDALSKVLWADDKPLYLVDSRCKVWDMRHCGYAATHITVKAINPKRRERELQLKRPDQPLRRNQLLS